MMEIDCADFLKNHLYQITVTFYTLNYTSPYCIDQLVPKPTSFVLHDLIMPSDHIVQRS